MNKPYYLSHSIELSIPFHDVDSMQVVWHGNYFRYFENAREALLKKLAFGYSEMVLSDYYWPIIDTHAKYIRPLRFEQKIEVFAYLTEYENRLRIDYEIMDALSKKITTKAYTIQAAVHKNTQEICFVIPEVFLNAINGLKK